MGRATGTSDPTNRVLAAVLGLLLVAAFGVMAVSRLRSLADAEPPAELASTAEDSSLGDRAVSPVVAGRVLPVADELLQAPVPSQWGGGTAGVPFAQWWSSAAVGPGANTLWSKPLATRINAEGRTEIAAPQPVLASDGTVNSPFVPALSMLPLGDGQTVSVSGAGAFHVVLDLESPSSGGISAQRVSRFSP